MHISIFYEDSPRMSDDEIGLIFEQIVRGKDESAGPELGE